MTKRLEGRCALVTGAASGFGAEIARRYAAEGAKVAVVDRDEDGAKRIAAEIGAPAIARRADVTVADDVTAAVEATKAAFGDLDLIVNNAGASHPNRPMLEVDEAEFDRVYAVNVKSIFLMAHAAVPHLRSRGGGHHQHHLDRRHPPAAGLELV